MQEIRLTWWREALDEVFAGRAPRRHPVALALADAVRRRNLPQPPLEAMIEARIAAIAAPRLADEAAIWRHIDATAGALMGLAAATLDAAAPVSASSAAARAWGLSGLARLRRAGVDHLPQGWNETAVAGRVRAMLGQARGQTRALPVAAFPALAYATLAAPYAAGRNPSELEKRLRLTAAVLTGRI